MSESFEKLKSALRKLPGTGMKSAERMALHLALENQSDARALASSIISALEHITPCPVCGGLSEDGELCEICKNPARSDSAICVVERAERHRRNRKIGRMARQIPCFGRQAFSAEKNRRGKPQHGVAGKAHRKRGGRGNHARALERHRGKGDLPFHSGAHCRLEARAAYAHRLRTAERKPAGLCGLRDNQKRARFKKIILTKKHKNETVFNILHFSRFRAVRKRAADGRRNRRGRKGGGDPPKTGGKARPQAARRPT